MSKTRILSLALFAAALIPASLIVTRSWGLPQKADLNQPSGYTGYFRYLMADRQGELRPWSLVIRYQSATGDWRTDMLRYQNGELVPMPNGTTISSRENGGQIRNAGKGKGIFQGPPLESMLVDEELLRNGPSFAGEGEILGYRTIMLEDRKQGALIHIAPELGIVPIRSETSSMVMEPLQIIVGEPSPEVFESPGLQDVDTEGYQFLVDTATTGQSADQLQGALERFLEADEKKRKARDKAQKP